MDRPKPDKPTYVLDFERLKEKVESQPPTCRFCRAVLPVDDLVFWCDHLLGHSEVQGKDREEVMQARAEIVVFTQLPPEYRRAYMMRWTQQELDRNPALMQKLMAAGILSKVRKDG